MFEPNPNLVEKLTPPSRPLTPLFIDGWADRLYPHPEVRDGRRQAIANYVEAVGRLVLKSEQLASKAGFFVAPTFIHIPPAVNQHETYDLYESYFQSLYKTLSGSS